MTEYFLTRNPEAGGPPFVWNCSLNSNIWLLINEIGFKNVLFIKSLYLHVIHSRQMSVESTHRYIRASRPWSHIQYDDQLSRSVSARSVVT